MKLLVKRDWLNTFEEAKIEIEEVKEFSFLQIAVKNYIDYMEKNGFKHSEDEDIRELYERAIRISIVLDNEMEWKN
ncbi:hypothetical protein [Niallia sp. 03190]|uniref:hypothetical protein n=1 Tax=Niallia sp. 03190 TaxID=3458061 RepID=UPI0040446BE2